LRLDKPAQGVFYGNSTRVTNDAWRIAKEQGVQPVTVGNLVIMLFLDQTEVMQVEWAGSDKISTM
jgi:hypothetical protein